MYRKKLLPIFLASALLWQLLSCNGSGSPPTEIEYPKDWPIASLKLPPEAKPAKVITGFEDECDESNGYVATTDYYKVKKWAVGFTYTGGKEKLMEHIDAIAADAGFQTQGQFEGIERYYWCRDLSAEVGQQPGFKQTMILLYNARSQPNAYILEIDDMDADRF